MYLIVQSLWNESITQRLVEGASRRLKEADQSFEIAQVPGAMEIPVAALWALENSQVTKKNLRGIVACGAVIRGETLHFDLVARESTRALMDLGMKWKTPIGHAILAVDTIEQAQERATDDWQHNKGWDAADAVLAMNRLKIEKKWD